ncbi:aspartate kinase [Chloroflexia bacterium SDU3-3]|nr:aspartate kinase [Chloroflexia bacterium SDU3-3]
MSLLVMKFGGTSVGSAAAIAQLVSIAVDQRKTWDQVGVVVSAMSGVTDMLIGGAKAAAAGDDAPYQANAAKMRQKHAEALAELAGESEDTRAVLATINGLIDDFELLCRSVHVLGDLTPRAHDAIASLGERMSARLVACAMRARGLDSESIDATEFVVTSDEFSSAVPLHVQTRALAAVRVRPVLERGAVPVMTGYIGATESGVTTTLGRGGSDYSGAIIGSALDADEVAIYTDVDGVMTTDPRLAKNARVLPVLSFLEMSELAYFGAKVLHPRTVRPCVERGIPLRIRNTFNPEHEGTLLVQQAEDDGRAVRAVAAIKDLSMVTVEGRGMIGVPGVAAKTFGSVAAAGANVLMISQASSEQSICFVVPAASASATVAALEDGLRHELERRDIDRIWAREGIVIVTAVGAGMRERPGVAAQVLTSLSSQGINVIAIAQGSSECAISVVVGAQDGDAAVRAIHELAI